MSTSTVERAKELEAELDEAVLFQDCLKNVLKNLDRNIDRQKELPNKVSQFLSMKWYMQNELTKDLA
ncbi:MAG: hypothetical protein R8G66_25490 [Cytophagales bacterium]|nr:hypothetical protein [Cytophagales bacterium]